MGINLGSETREFLENLERQTEPAIRLESLAGPEAEEESSPPGAPPISWPSVARILVEVGDRRLQGYGPDLGLDEEEKATLASVWGAVIEKYAPDVGAYGPETVAAVATLAILESRIRKIQTLGGEE